MEESVANIDTDIRVRSARIEDWDAIMVLLDVTWHASYDNIMGPQAVNQVVATFPQFKAMIDDPRLSFERPMLIAETEGRIVGMTCIRHSVWGQGVILDMLYVSSVPTFCVAATIRA